MNEAENSAPKQRGFQKGRSGNPAGKPPGTRNKMTLLAEALLDNEAEALVVDMSGLSSVPQRNPGWHVCNTAAPREELERDPLQPRR